MCALIGKARNLVVVITMKSTGRSFAARIIDFDDDFLEVIVRLGENSDYLANREDFLKGENKQERILVAINDISTIV